MPTTVEAYVIIGRPINDGTAEETRSAWENEDRVTVVFNFQAALEEAMSFEEFRLEQESTEPSSLPRYQWRGHPFWFDNEKQEFDFNQVLGQWSASTDACWHLDEINATGAVVAPDRAIIHEVDLTEDLIENGAELVKMITDLTREHTFYDKLLVDRQGPIKTPFPEEIPASLVVDFKKPAEQVASNLKNNLRSDIENVREDQILPLVRSIIRTERRIKKAIGGATGTARLYVFMMEEERIRRHLLKEMKSERTTEHVFRTMRQIVQEHLDDIEGIAIA